MKLSHLPTRLATGAFLVNSGVEKLAATDDAAKLWHDRACVAFPFVRRLEPRVFARLLGLGELALGGALLSPMVPPATAGLGLTAFSTALLRLYLKTPGLTKEDGIRPTAQGTPLAKDVWMLGIGLSLILDAARPRRRIFRRRLGDRRRLQNSRVRAIEAIRRTA